MLLIIITGLPATGKTSLGRKIAKEFDLPFFSKDDFKELIFDSLGAKDRDWSMQIGRTSYDILYHIAEENMKANYSQIIETNFKPKFANKTLNDLKEKYGFNVVQIRCKADEDLIFKRFKQRVESGNRHAGHVDDLQSEDLLKKSFKGGAIDPIEIEGKFIDIDTTDFSKIDYTGIFEEIHKQLKK